MRVNCVGAVVLDDARRLLLIRRGRPPGEGRWSLPGGRVEPGESDADAVRREVREETGLEVAVGPLAGTVDLPALGGDTYEVRDYHARVVGGALTPGDDAADARWCTPEEVMDLPLTTGLLETLRSWNVLPPP